jgi:NADPH:quinone reductase-like Zn-dependent oxidoreductase
VATEVLLICSRSQIARAEFSDLLEWCAQGRLRPPIDLHYGLDEIREAPSHLESGEQFGKIAIDI